MAYVRKMEVYGYSIVYKRPEASGEDRWIVDQDDEYANLPAHYLSVEEALDRVEYLRVRNIEARVAALMAEESDDPDESKANRGSDQD
jgi:hypothetical protein